MGQGSRFVWSCYWSIGARGVVGRSGWMSRFVVSLGGSVVACYPGPFHHLAAHVLVLAAVTSYDYDRWVVGQALCWVAGAYYPNQEHWESDWDLLIAAVVCLLDLTSRTDDQLLAAVGFSSVDRNQDVGDLAYLPVVRHVDYRVDRLADRLEARAHHMSQLVVVAFDADPSEGVVVSGPFLAVVVLVSRRVVRVIDLAAVVHTDLVHLCSSQVPDQIGSWVRACLAAYHPAASVLAQVVHGCGVHRTVCQQGELRVTLHILLLPVHSHNHYLAHTHHTHHHPHAH